MTSLIWAEAISSVRWAYTANATA